MKKWLLLAALVLLPSTSVEASILGGLLDYDGSRDTLKDASAGNIIERENIEGSTIDGTLEKGDIIQGIVHFNQIDGNSSFSGSVFAAYSFEVVTASVSEITVKAATGAFNVRTILSGASVDMSGLTAYKSRSSDVGLVVLENGQTGINLEDNNGTAAGKTGFNGGADGAKDGLANAFNSSWTAVLTGGFVGSNDEHKITRTLTTIDINDLTGPGGTGRGIGTVGAGVQFASFAGNYSVLEVYGPLGGSTAYLANDNAALGTSAEITIANGSLQGFDAEESGENWQFQDDGDYKINPIPEPSTIAIWAALGLGGCGLVARRRMKAKKA